MKRYVYSLGAVMLLGCCMPALAQGYFGGPAPGPDYNPPKRYLAGGYTVATGEAANFVDNGWNIGSGVQFRLPPGPVSLRLDAEYSRNNATNQLLSEGAAANQTQVNHGRSELFSMDLDAVYEFPLSRSINAYVMAGGGGAIRHISLTRRVASGGPQCDAWAGFCDADPNNVLVDSKNTGRWEWNAGVGLSFSIGDGGDAFFVEVRYMEVETPVPTGFVPIRVGLLL
jgi:opacity protein-like surface antigen